MTDDERDVWNRACEHNVKQKPRLYEADLALSALLLAHGFICNGGVYHGVVDCLSPDQFQAAIKGYRYFGLQKTADLLEKARKEYKTDGGNDRSVNEIYYKITKDSDISARFQEHFQKNRKLYAP